MFMKTPEETYLFHLTRKDKNEILVYIASKKDWDRNSLFPSRILNEEKLDETLSELGLERGDAGVYCLTESITKNELIANLVDAGFETQEDFSLYIEKLEKTEDMMNDDGDEDLEDPDNFIPPFDEDEVLDEDSYLDLDGR
jgi:hypothetical protein